jgi:hypothetical protein
LYISTGGASKGGIKLEASCYLLTPKAEFKGKTSTHIDNKGKYTYTGEVVKFRKDEYVMTGPAITFKDPDADKLWKEKYPDLDKKEPSDIVIPPQEIDHIETKLEQKRCAKCKGQQDTEHRCSIHKWDCPKGALIDFTTLEIKTSHKEGSPHILSCSGKKAQGEDLKEATIGLCRELGIKFDSPASLVETLKTGWPDSPERNRLINFLEPVKV